MSKQDIIKKAYSFRGVSDQRAQLEVLCKAPEDAGVVTSYTISETATDKIFDISFNE
jgi:hypothetical protein